MLGCHTYWNSSFEECVCVLFRIYCQYITDLLIVDESGTLAADQLPEEKKKKNIFMMLFGSRK